MSGQAPATTEVADTDTVVVVVESDATVDVVELSPMVLVLLLGAVDGADDVDVVAGTVEGGTVGTDDDSVIGVLGGATGPTVVGGAVVVGGATVVVVVRGTKITSASGGTRTSSASSARAE